MCPKEPNKNARSERNNAEDLAMLRRIEAEVELEKLKATRDASSLASEHLGVYGGAYLCVLVLAFYGGALYLPESSLSVVATLTTVVAGALISLLRQVVSGNGHGHEDEGRE